jgi:signal transduction histidine kinase
LSGQPDWRKSGLRLLAAGVAAAALAWGAGRALERSRFGGSDQEAAARIEAELRERFDRAAETLSAIARRVAASGPIIPDRSRDPAAVSRLFETLAANLPSEPTRTTGITIYTHPGGAALAWSGRVSDLPRERIEGPTALFVAPRGRLIRIEPIVDPERPTNRLATIAVEQSLGDQRPAAASSPGIDDTLVVQTSIAPVVLRTVVAPVATRSPFNFLIPATSGQVLMEGEVRPEDVAAARVRWRTGTAGIVWSVIGITLLVWCTVLMDVRRQARDRRTALLATAVVLATLVAARAAFATAITPGPLEPLELLLTALLLAFSVWLLLDLVERRRVVTPRPRLVRETSSNIAETALLYFLAGSAGAAIVWTYERALGVFVSQSTLDLTHFSLHPLVPSRLALAFGLVLVHAAVLWTAVLLLRLVAVGWRRVRSALLFAVSCAGWLAGVGVSIIVARRTAGEVPLAALVVPLAAVAALELALAQPRGRARRASHTARLFVLYVALLVPALALYPALRAFASEAKERLIAENYGPQAASQRDDLWRRRVPQALEQIDAMPTLGDFVTGSAEDQAATPTRDRAFLVWSQTSLAQYRLTSSVDLYAANGRLVSSFALNLPEYTPTPFVGGCSEWDLYEEVPPFASTERKVLRASRGICERGRPLGGIVARVMFDFRDLPFISVEQRYLKSLDPDAAAQVEDDLGRDIELTVYGWSRAPLYSSGSRVSPLSDEIFERMMTSREPFWATEIRGDRAFRVYFLNDRAGIYALGYPAVTWFGDLINLAELVTLTFVLYILMLGTATAFNAFFSSAPAGGRALLRELRSSFYRKLFMFFVLASVVPVGILALATSTYFTRQLRARVESGALDTAAVAQRLVEDYAALQERGAQALELLDDQIMLLVGRAIDQDVDLFDGPRLRATSQRDLFASGALSERTPSEVYRQIAIERRPMFVGVEEMRGQPYQLAAAAVRAGGREGIVTVPQTLRRAEIERQIDDLNRQIVLGLVLFVLFGAGIGYWMAERIADPVNRLTRATRRIARGDLDARIAATSSDELRRLVEDFNRMAADLKRQRVELERTQRLEAWADMARQVAHDIKNPLTPIQLSAEHARRVNQDRGSPLSPALDECITSILSQVKLLRQIAAEFSSFASSPTAHPEPTELPALVDEVVAPYRAGLEGRVELNVESASILPRVNIDRTLFARALTNVIENALHAMPGGGRLTIVSRRTATPDQPIDRQSESRSQQPDAADRQAPVIVDVTDTGVGMDPEALARIFEPYFSTKASGTGLGLTIARRNIELIGGTVSVKSERGRGTTVTIALPVDS